MAVKNGKPATGFNAQDRKWVREVVQNEAIAVEALSVTENNTYIAPAGKAYSPVTVNVPNPSTGKVNITSTAEVDVTNYATAQVVDANLVAGNIKKDTTILGITGSYEGGSSDFSTAEVTLVLTLKNGYPIAEETFYYMIDFPDSENPTSFEGVEAIDHVCNIILYNGEASGLQIIASDVNYDDYPAIDGTPTVTGGVTYDSDTHKFTVTGNGTITMTMKGAV